jgi:hypothetical protein
MPVGVAKDLADADTNLFIRGINKLVSDCHGHRCVTQSRMGIV